MPDEGNDSVAAPGLEVGGSWTYEATGLYNTGERFTVVVAERTAEGYLFGGEGREDLLEDIAWGRVWHGPVSGSLNPLDREGNERVTLFDFPLHDGKSWDRGDGEVTVTKGPVPTPEGEREGYVMEQTYANGYDRWTYEEEVGYLTRYESVTGDRVFLRIDLVSTGESEAWIWYERVGERVDVGGFEPGAETSFVPSEAASVVISAGAANQGSAWVKPPPTAAVEPWMHHVEGEEAWAYDALSSPEGAWTFSVTAREDAFAWVSAQPVAWIEP